MLIDKSDGTTRTYYFQLDDLNTVHALLDDQGHQIERYDYSAYGETRILGSNGQTLMVDDDQDEEFDVNQDGIIDIGYPRAGEPVTPRVVATQSQFDNPFGYAGMRRDEHTGLYHTHYREYNPNLGRWLTPDPAGYQDGQNLYAYYPNVNGVDVLGLDSYGRGFFPWAKHNSSKFHDISTDEMYDIYQKEMNSVGILDYMVPAHSQAFRTHPLPQDTLAALDLGKKLRTTAIGVASVPYAAGTFGPLAAELPGPTMAYVAASNFVATTPWAMNTVTCLGYGMQALGVGAFAFGDDETRAMMVSAPGGAEAIMAMGSVFLSKGFNFASMYNNKAYQLNVWIRTRHLPQVAIGESSIDFLSKQGNLVHAGNDVALKRLRLNALERGGFVIALNEKVTAEKNILYFPLKNMPRIYALHEYSHAATHNNLGYAAEEVRAWKEVLSWGNFIGGWTEGETQLINSLIKLHGK